MGDFGQMWWSPRDEETPPVEQWPRIEECREWDGLFSISASNGSSRLFLTAFCDNGHEGSFKIEENDSTISEGTTRVSHAPAIVEDDGYTFPAGAYFGAGRWEIECQSSAGRTYQVIAEVRNWNSID